MISIQKRRDAEYVGDGVDLYFQQGLPAPVCSRCGSDERFRINIGKNHGVESFQITCLTCGQNRGGCHVDPARQVKLGEGSRRRLKA